jgi:UDP-glucuronate 4-epimerase
MEVLITGAAGFIGFFLAEKLLSQGFEIVGLDNINDYYDPKLKFARLNESGISEEAKKWNQVVKSSKYSNYRFVRMNLEDKGMLMDLCKQEKFDVIINLAAQAGVRYSIENPDAYVQSNVVGFLNILEACRYNHVKHLIYASSSSVYGLNAEMPFSVDNATNHTVSLYAATKKSNELMAHTYSHLFNIPTSGLRFFTVYGPWGRPDMAYFLFADAIKKGKPIKVFNYGKMQRDFTYIDDIVDGIIKTLHNPAKSSENWDPEKPNPSISSAPYRIYNIGNNQPVELLAFIKELEINIGKDAIMNFMEIQDGDVVATWSDIKELEAYGYNPSTSIQTGIKQFVQWYSGYYGTE